MSKVHILTSEVISKIAAGEVIERPASVIKELLENSLDARADSVEIEIKEAGKKLIRVKDTGTGIGRDDLERIFARHATSKIQTVDDLYDIHSLGFRGEALYSISAISDILLKSRASGQDSGWEIHLQAGKRLTLRPAAITQGTEIEVNELFFNTPARRKFLKSDSTELNQIIGTVVPYTLAYPKIRFLLKHNSKALIDLPSQTNFIPRIAQSLNVDEQYLIEVKKEMPQQGISFHLILGDINIHRSRRDLQFIFVNNRPVQNKSIAFHLNEVYRLILAPGSYPFFAVYLSIPPGDIDVNVHPTKREVKIRDEVNLCSILRHICEQALMSASQTKQVTDSKEPLSDQPSIKKALAKTITSEVGIDEILPREIFGAHTKPQPTEQYTFPSQEHFSMAGTTMMTQKKDSLKTKLAKSKFVGTFINKFQLFEADQSLLIIDQHAAQERIMFESLIKQMEKGKIEVQHLLSPYLLKVSVRELLAWEESKKKLDEIGFASTQFDNETIAVHTYPVLLAEPEKAVRDLLAGEPIIRCSHEQIARRACRCSVMAGDVLNQQQAEYQRDHLLKCRDPFTCPHGRPTVVEMTEGFLDKQFLRT